ncbi:hypothetical protein M2163_000557 [Streptomyces sp. SAI-135]|jgi:hypothetical protein|nr:hypothetical protein [Streptomyces sp. SAI-090]MDH6581445.1 hypothetical protein [Streptomyces sp. SAI-133]MDH6613449.1 hypothetical protein [Streptomyces sp. SAI-135]
MVALVYLREHTTPAKIAAACGTGEPAAHASTSTVIQLLAVRAPGLLKVLRDADWSPVRTAGCGDSPALPGRAHDLTAARTHRIIRICERQGVPILAGLADQGGDLWVITGRASNADPLQELTPTEKTVNQALAAVRAPVERERRAPEVLADLPHIAAEPPGQNVRS